MNALDEHAFEQRLADSVQLCILVRLDSHGNRHQHHIAHVNHSDPMFLEMSEELALIVENKNFTNILAWGQSPCFEVRASFFQFIFTIDTRGFGRGRLGI